MERGKGGEEATRGGGKGASMAATEASCSMACFHGGEDSVSNNSETKRHLIISHAEP